MDGMFFDSWATLFRTFLVGVMAYVILAAFLRVSGKRTLSKMNAFDLIVTVALGSTLATVLLSKAPIPSLGAVVCSRSSLAMMVGAAASQLPISGRRPWG